jgi:nucleotide-binding universal stress UspA family protein
VTRVAGDPAPSDDIVNAARARIGGVGGVEPYAAYGEPVEELARFSAAVDLLVIGSGRHGSTRTPHHDTTEQHLARMAHCALLIVTPSAFGQA